MSIFYVKGKLPTTSDQIANNPQQNIQGCQYQNCFYYRYFFTVPETNLHWNRCGFVFFVYFSNYMQIEYN